MTFDLYAVAAPQGATARPPAVGGLIWSSAMHEGAYRAVPTIRFLDKWARHRQALRAVGFDVVIVRVEPIDKRVVFNPTAADRDEIDRVVAIAFPTRKKRAKP